MHTGLEEAPNGFQRMAAFYRQRAAGGVSLIVTGGIAPNWAGRVSPLSAKLTTQKEATQHQIITKAVHEAGGKICLQILHTGRYAYHPLAVAPSAIKSPISPFKPWKLNNMGIIRTINAFVKTAKLAQKAGYDGVEIMGSEGYLINQFIATKTNKRTDKWGGSYENRIRLPLEIIQQVRAAVGENFIIIYRLSMLDLVDGGSTWEEVVQLAKAVEKAGATIINTGIGWHEARIPTIATMVPRAGFAWVTEKMMGEVSIPLITTNRINTPEVAENILQKGQADMVSMARPFLADPDFMNKAKSGKEKQINTCIACNQACLDHIFNQTIASCLVNPKAAFETEFISKSISKTKKIAVIGAGPAGLAFSVEAAQRGHEIHLFEQSQAIGGQFNLAKQIPGKEEFHETLRYYQNQLTLHKVHIHLDTKVSKALLDENQFDEIVVATGVNPRKPPIDGIQHSKVISYFDLLTKHPKIGKKVAIIGAGGIGFDVAEYLIHQKDEDFYKFWGIDKSLTHPSGLVKPSPIQSPRAVYLLQRSKKRQGKGLGKTTGWIHRMQVKKAGVHQLTGVQYDKIDDKGLHITIGDKSQILEVDHIIICAGQESNNTLFETLQKDGYPVHLIGGALNASGVDAKRAIKEGILLGLEI